jgi:hypothetical protein
VDRYGKVWYKPSLYEDWLQSDANIDGETFVGFQDIKSAIEVVLPSKVENSTNVTKIAKNAFRGC